MSKKQLSRYVLTDELYALLKQQILSHVMPAGEKINIDKLAREFGVSNIPIRESLFRLASEGFVTVIPFKGMFVAEMSLKDINEIFEIRTQLEELAIRKAAPRIAKERLQQILQELERGDTAGAEEDSEEKAIRQMNDGLHGTLLLYADNFNLQQMASALIERIHRYLNLHHYKIDLEAERAEHRSIVNQLLADNTEEAVKAMRRHLQNSYERLVANFK
ncbi:GntR family transcriptional regulator [Paenibacillus lycopersici]|uniref:GntR family transcriptional regulator n=1 Tax=Paenibacillus lycopersici TaxID=2704462 RepID=A0A6C0FSJ5_9BACL|nr:GntR family transcriptional regulator [Paenibacillus lycopersici]QHT59827.1 GntR family transcriptional regulator [Paenibacillus lycopersici]